MYPTLLFRRNILSDKKITQSMVTALIASSLIEHVKLGRKTTVVSCTLPNGFVIVESSSCVDPENYDHEMGKSICLKRIEDKIWAFEEYRLQCSLTSDIDNIARVCHEVNKAFCESMTISFPKYVDFVDYDDDDNCALRLTGVDNVNNRASYWRDGGCWECTVSMIGGNLIITDCIEKNLVGEKLIEVSFEHYENSNGEYTQLRLL